MEEKHVTKEATELFKVHIIPFQFRHIMYNLINNSLKFSKPNIAPHIIIKSSIKKGGDLNDVKLSDEQNYCHIRISDNDIGFEPEYNDKIFEVFQKLHSINKYPGTGIGLVIIKKIVANHNDIINSQNIYDNNKKTRYLDGSFKS